MSSPAAPGSYPGNPSLPAEVREKILATFRHALNLFSSGNVSDCVIGCEFILKMDPRFTPAQRLREKARNRESDVDIGELQALVNPPQPGSPAAPPPPAPAPAAPPPPAPAPARAAEPRVEKPDPQRLLAEAEQKYEARDFEGASAAAARALTLAPGSKEALALIERAAGKKAMEPLIEASVAHAEEALAEGRIPDARREVERLRSADPTHPALPSLDRRISSPSAPSAPPPPDSAPGPHGSDEFSLGGPQSEGYDATPAFGDLSSEPAGLDPAPAAPSGLPPASSDGAFPQGGGSPGFFRFDDTSPEADAFAPSHLPPHDMFLPAEETPGTPVPSLSAPEIDEEEARASEREIGNLIKQGDEIAKKGDREQAIEIWSRVFLIDINNSEAVTRIENARQEISDDSRLVAECLKKGRESFEAGDRESARRFFLQAQSLDSREPTAALYLERIETGESDKAAPGAVGAAPPRAAIPAALDDFPQASPPPAAAPAPRERRAGVPINARVLAVIGAFLALTLVGVYFVFKGNRPQAPPAQKAVSSGSVQHARELLDKGQVREARIELLHIGPNDPESEEAHKLLASLDKGGAKETGKAPGPGPAPGAASSEPRGDNDPAHLRGVAEKALAEKRYIDALKNFNLAAPAFRDDPSFAQQQGVASDKVTALTPAVKFYNEGEYETAIPILWRIVQEDRDNQDARSYLLRSYYNQGITQLQNGLYQKAILAFREALALDSNDSDAARHLKFAERYQKGDLDLMGRIYVRHLNHRR